MCIPMCPFMKGKQGVCVCVGGGGYVCVHVCTCVHVCVCGDRHEGRGERQTRWEEREERQTWLYQLNNKIEG